jgi:tetratricopeptide (TPR) repeat protein/transglutaminase-like putative cysteine protease
MMLGSAALARTACGVALLAGLPSLPLRASMGNQAALPDAFGPFEAELARQTARLSARVARPEAMAPLAALLSLEDNLPSGALEPALRQAAGSGSHPLVAAQATFHLARLLDQRGDRAGALAARAPLGLVSQGFVIGPFGEGRASFDQSFPPETEKNAPERDKRYRGKSTDVGWRSADDVVRDGALFLDGLLRPDSQTAAYVVTFVRSDREQDAALRLGSPGPTKVWVNGAKIFARDVVRTPTLDQDAAPVHLGRGWNRILVKTVVTDGAWRIYLRFTDPAGRPLTLEGAAEMPGNVPPPPRARSRPPAPVQALDEILRRRASAAPARPGGAEAWLDLGAALAWIEPGDRDAREAAAALETGLKWASARRPSLEALQLLADLARDEDERRRVLERALALAEQAAAPSDGDTRSARALILSRLGDTARSQRRDAVALPRWQQALQIDPTCWPASLALADEEQGAGLPQVAVARIEALPAPARAVPRVRRQLARLLEVAGRQRDAEHVLEDLVRERQHDVELQHQLATRARARGDTRQFIAYLQDAAALRPDLSALSLELGRALEGAGQGAQAVAVLTELAARLPDDPGVLAQLGKLLHRLGRRDEALVRLRAAVALRPQDPELRRYAERAAVGEGPDDASGEDLARRYAADARLLLAEPTRPVVQGAASEGDATVLLDRRVVRVHRNGLSQTFAQRIVAIRTEHGAEENKEFFVRYTPGSEDVEIRQARLYRRGAGGEVAVLEAAERDDQDLSEPWYGLYYDNRAEVVRFEGLRAGDVLEVQYVVEDVAAENQLADYFGDLQTIAEGIPKRLWEYTLIAPATRSIYSNTPRVPRLSHSVTLQGDERVYAFSARDVTALDTEPAMPGLSEVAPYLHLSTYASWEDVGRWYWHLVEEQLTPDDDLRRAARAAVTPGMSEVARVRAIHNLVVTGTRYVGLEFGIHGFKPYKVTQVLARRFGDCKDKASLMVALLREVGVESELVLVRTRRGGLIDHEPASLSVFDHAITYVPKLDVYLDGTAEFAGMAELPTQDQGVMVLRVGPRGAHLAETPVLPSKDNRVERHWRVELGPDGDARVLEDLRIQGQAAADWREHYQTPGERPERYGRVWTGRYPGARLMSIEMPGIEDRNAPVVVHDEAAVPRFGLPASEREAGRGVTPLTLPLAVREADFARTYARLSVRRHDLLIAYPWQHDEEVVYQLPPGWKLLSGGSPRELTSPFGRLRLDVASLPGGLVRVHSFLDVTRVRIPPADYALFRSFLGDIDAALAERLVVGPVGATP